MTAPRYFASYKAYSTLEARIRCAQCRIYRTHDSFASASASAFTPRPGTCIKCIIFNATDDEMIYAQHSVVPTGRQELARRIKSVVEALIDDHFKQIQLDADEKLAALRTSGSAVGGRFRPRRLLESIAVAKETFRNEIEELAGKKVETEEEEVSELAEELLDLKNAQKGRLVCNRTSRSAQDDPASRPKASPSLEDLSEDISLTSREVQSFNGLIYEASFMEHSGIEDDAMDTDAIEEAIVLSDEAIVLKEKTIADRTQIKKDILVDDSSGLKTMASRHEGRKRKRSSSASSAKESASSAKESTTDSDSASGTPNELYSLMTIFMGVMSDAKKILSTDGMKTLQRNRPEWPTDADEAETALATTRKIITAIRASEDKESRQEYDQSQINLRELADKSEKYHTKQIQLLENRIGRLCGQRSYGSEYTEVVTKLRQSQSIVRGHVERRETPQEVDQYWMEPVLSDETKRTLASLK